MTKICHLTTVHPRHDLRIVGKECVTLAKAGYQVHVIVSDGLGDEKTQGVRIIDAGGISGGRISRMLLGTARVLLRALQLKAELYHFHDPELIPAGLVLRTLGHRVVYDVHEDVARSLDNRPWVPSLLKKVFAAGIEGLEYAAARVFDLQVVVTPEIARRFPRRRTVLLRNFPILDELVPRAPLPFELREPLFAYVGTVSPDRGAFVMVEAVNHPSLAQRARLVIAGVIEPELQEQMRIRDTHGLVSFAGHISRAGVRELLQRARAGLVLLQPVKAHMDAYPVKMFEYLAAALPVIASNHPLWVELLDQGEFALLVDPTQPAAIAAAMQTILDDPAQAGELARKGAVAVRNRYSWDSEKRGLLDAYHQLLECTIV